jgi:peptidoglycan hydrolase-like protein with peptidoglycan-binding domain
MKAPAKLGQQPLDSRQSQRPRQERDPEQARPAGEAVDPGVRVGLAPPEVEILQLQRTHGNAHVARLLAATHPAPIQRLSVKQGDRGSEVREVQELLNKAQPAPDPLLNPDGKFGSKTRAAVVALQRHHGLKGLGMVGPKTWALLTGKPAKPDGKTKSPGKVPAPVSASESEKEPAQTNPGLIGNVVESIVEKTMSALSGETPAESLPPNLVQQELDRFYKEFAAFPVVIRGTKEKPVVPARTVRVHPPYFINVNENSKGLSKEVFAEAEEARAKPAVRAFFTHVGKEQALGGWMALHGKATMANLQQILEEALERGLIQPQDEARPTAEDLETWLRTHGVGVDCSGFVSQALTSVLQKQRHAAGLEGPVKPISLGSKGLKGGSKDFAKVGEGKDCKGPRCLQPGDTMYIPGHIRILASVEAKDGGIQFTTFESAAAKRKRLGLTTAYWFYPDPGSFKNLKIRRDESKPWAATGEKPTFGRLNDLAASD